jgi:hypothetical protein
LYVPSPSKSQDPGPTSVPSEIESPHTQSMMKGKKSVLVIPPSKLPSRHSQGTVCAWVVQAEQAIAVSRNTIFRFIYEYNTLTVDFCYG